MNAQRSLLNWCQTNLSGYPSIKVKDFSASWRDGRAFLALLSRFRPNKIDVEAASERSNMENLNRAFSFAESEFGITRLLDPEGSYHQLLLSPTVGLFQQLYFVSDVDTEYPDDRSIMTYVSMIQSAVQANNSSMPVNDELKLENVSPGYLVLGDDSETCSLTPLFIFGGSRNDARFWRNTCSFAARSCAGSRTPLPRWTTNMCQMTSTRSR